MRANQDDMWASFSKSLIEIYMKRHDWKSKWKLLHLEACRKGFVALCHQPLAWAWRESKQKAGEKKVKRNKQASWDRLIEGPELMFVFLNAEKWPSTAVWPSSYWIISLTQCHWVSFQAAWKRDYALWYPPKAKEPESQCLSDFIPLFILPSEEKPWLSPRQTMPSLPRGDYLIPAFREFNIIWKWLIWKVLLLFFFFLFSCQRFFYRYIFGSHYSPCVSLSAFKRKHKDQWTVVYSLVYSVCLNNNEYEDMWL